MKRETNDIKPIKDSRRQSAVRSLLVCSAISFFLCLIKFFGYGISGSLLALGSAFDSLGDVMMSLLNAWSHRQSRKHADQRHPFGHGGIEVLTSLLQGLFLSGMAFYVGAKAIWRFLGESTIALDVDGLPIAIIVLLGSALGGLLINFILGAAQKKDHEAKASLSVQADWAHYRADAITNFLGALGLGLVWYLGEQRLDAIFGLLSSILLGHLAWPILKRTFSDIIHEGASFEVRQKLHDVALGSDLRILDVHRLRTRRLGPTLFVDLHLVLPDHMPLSIAHGIGDHAVQVIRQEFPEADVFVHLDPLSEPIDDIPNQSSGFFNQ